MRLITGPAGSGRTTLVLERIRAALRAGDSSVRLLAPTATLAQHWQNLFAREGFILRSDLIQTLSRFVDRWAGDLHAISEPALYLLVEDAIRVVNRPEFIRVAKLPGFCASLARTITEFSAAGCDSGRLSRLLPDASLGPAFLAVYRAVDRELARRGQALRAQRLEQAAARIDAEGLDGIRSIYLDGFHTLPEPELHVIAALDRHADVTLVAQESAHFKALFPDAAREVCHGRKRSEPELVLFRAPSLERECAEIARRIQEEASAGRAFREMGIVVRAADAYVPVLRTALGRAGIPARFYFDSSLDRHPAVRFLAGAVDAMLSGWDHASTLAFLRLAPRFVDSISMDRFDFDVRLQIPNAGLGALKSLLIGDDGQPVSSEAARLLHKIDRLARIEEWRSFALAPLDWAERLRGLRPMFRPARPAPDVSHEQALECRSNSAALELFDESLTEAGEALDPGREIGLEEYWRAVQAVIRMKPLRLEDGRRNVVHVLSAPEARQWELPVVFVCGLVEKRFPQFHRQDPFFPDAARCKLNRVNIRVRTAAEFEHEERALFDSAITRASVRVTLSYPEADERGDRNLPSIFLESLSGKVRDDTAALQSAPVYAACRPAAAGGIAKPDLLQYLRKKTERISPTALEAYLKCPFQFFASRILKLKTAPPLPNERLDFIAQGEIIHQTLADWYPVHGDIEPVFRQVFEGVVGERRVPAGYHTERLRNAMLEDLGEFAADDRWPRSGFESKTEEPFHFELGGVSITGKIDRLDIAPDGRAWVIDYKYSSKQSVKAKLEDENLLQPPLYLMAGAQSFQLKPAGMFYAGLKGAGVTYAGWSSEPVGPLEYQPIPGNWFEITMQKTLLAVEEIRAGRIDAEPGDLGSCRYCEFHDFCRRRAGQPVRLAEGA